MGDGSKLSPRYVWTVLLLIAVLPASPGTRVMAQTGKQEFCDLDVTFIERTPRYIPGPWVYPPTGPQYLGIGDHHFTEEELQGAHRQWPNPGEDVTFTAHVANKSAQASPPCTFAWYLDGNQVAGGQLPAIDPWQETTQQLHWSWDQGPHTVRFVADSAGAVQEICEQNNALEDRTDAAALQMRVTPELYQAFQTEPNGIGSYSFEDWVQRHVKIMNGVLAGSSYPVTAPEGILERVRVDEFRFMSKADMYTYQPQPFGFDGGWNYYDDALGTPQSWFAYHIQDDFVARVDTGLIHELTHQIGVIDTYALALAPPWNHVRDADGELVMIAYQTKNPDMMGGGGPFIDFDGVPRPMLLFTPDANGNVTVATTGTFAAYCEENAGGLNSLKGLRRGHFGLYLFDIPQESFVQILDNQGQPVAGARIHVYQENPYPGPQSIPGQPVYQGATDPQGLFALGPAPLGNISCIGINGDLFFVIEARGHTEYRFLDVCNFNIAKWRGNPNQWTAVFKTGVPPKQAPRPPRHLRWGVLAPGQPGVLRWDASPSSDVVQYSVYRQYTYGPEDRPSGLSVNFEPPYVKVADVPATQTTCAITMIPGYAGANETPWFAVTAVDAAGRESAHARNRELVRWGPWADARVTRDDAHGVTLTLHPGTSWVQFRNSFVVTPGARVQFQVRTTSQRPLVLHLAVAGLGNVDLPLATLVPPGTDLADGQWHEVSADLRPTLDQLAAGSNVTPWQARTTWNQDWLVTACWLCDLRPAAQDAATFEFQEVQWVLPWGFCEPQGSGGQDGPGAIVPWGWESYGPCDVPPPNSGFVAIAAGGEHRLGLKTDGSIMAWGHNSYGQCDVPAPNAAFVAVAAGYYHSLGRKSDGSVVAWGYNGDGRCDVPTPDTGFVAIAAGGAHSLGLTGDGSILAWGNNDNGQCSVPAPGTGFVAVAAGFEHSLGLKADGSIVAWGRATEGQCAVPSPNAGIVAVAAGADHSLGLKSDGSIVAWGSNGDGQCDVPAPNADFVALAAGADHSLGAKTDGSILAWGNNDNGQCNVPTPSTGFVAVAAGNAHSVGLKASYGDLNCDGRVDFDDINPFVAALVDRQTYAARYARCHWLNADMNGDGSVDFDDISPFVRCLVSAQCP